MPSSLKKPTLKDCDYWKDSDGHWLILPDGWSIDGAQGCREDTKKELVARLKDSLNIEAV